DTERLPYREFSGLAQSANQMIAARRRYEQELKLNEQRFQLALDASRNHLWDVDLRRGEMSFSPGFYRYLGFDGVGQSHRFDVILALCHPDEREDVEQAVAGLRRHLLSAGLEFRLRNRDGVYRWF